MSSTTPKYLKGTYTFIQDGNIIGKSDNLITEDGERIILNYLADKRNSYADAISLGISTTTPLVTDNFLGLETFQIPIISRIVDFSQDPQQIIFRGTLTPSFVGKIYECGLVANPDYVLSSSFENILSNPSVLLNFDQNVEDWTLGTDASFYNDTTQQYLRAGKNSIELDHDTEDSIVISLETDEIFRSIFNQDVIKLGIYVKDDTPDNIVVSFQYDGTDDINWTISGSSLTANQYNIVEIEVGNLTNINTYEINLVNGVEITSTDTSNLSTVYLDILRIDQYSDISQQTLVSKSVLSTPITVSGNLSLDVEYRLEIDLT
jgi:hypothetical protein